MYVYVCICMYVYTYIHTHTEDSKPKIERHVSLQKIEECSTNIYIRIHMHAYMHAPQLLPRRSFRRKAQDSSLSA